MGTIYMIGLVLILALLVAVLGHVMYRWSRRHLTGMLTMIVAVVWVMLMFGSFKVLWVIVPSLVVYGLLARYPYLLKAK